MFKTFDYLIYSPHKSATQSVKATLAYSGFTVHHLHSSANFTPLEFSDSPRESWPIENRIALKLFLSQVKPKLIYIARDPICRLRSSYFQSKHEDAMEFNGYKKDETPIFKKNIWELYEDFISLIRSDSFPGKIDSILELESIIGCDLLNNLQNRPGFCFFESEDLTLYVLDFDKILLERENYLSYCLNTRIISFVERNLTVQKEYREKYDSFKTLELGAEIENIIMKRYEKIYQLIAQLKTSVKPKRQAIIF